MQNVKNFEEFVIVSNCWRKFPDYRSQIMLRKRSPYGPTVQKIMNSVGQSACPLPTTQLH